MADYESVVCVKNEVFVYRIPPRTSNRGYRADEWGLDKPDWIGRIRVVVKGHELFIKLEDKTSGELYAQCPVAVYPGPEVEQVLDSSRYFVIRVVDPSGRKAFIGIGFADRGDSFDLIVAMQDHFKWVKREKAAENNADSTVQQDTTPKLDLGFKEGQTIRINIGGKSDSGRTRPKNSGAGVGLLPPPPGGKILAPPSASVSSRLQEQPLSDASVSSSTQQVQPPGLGGAELLAGLSGPPTQVSSTSPSQAPQAASRAGDPWGEFASAGSASSTSNNTAPARQDPWVQF